MVLSKDRASSAVRFSLGKNTTGQEIDQAAKAIGRIMERLAQVKSSSTAAAYAVG
jgi:cysteine sulfinate desulfinase/cysteine desulfurase-like protein